MWNIYLVCSMKLHDFESIWDVFNDWDVVVRHVKQWKVVIDIFDVDQYLDGNYKSMLNLNEYVISVTYMTKKYFRRISIEMWIVSSRKVLIAFLPSWIFYSWNNIENAIFIFHYFLLPKLYEFFGHCILIDLSRGTSMWIGGKGWLRL